jgi:hypothetical protein
VHRAWVGVVVAVTLLSAACGGSSSSASNASQHSRRVTTTSTSTTSSTTTTTLNPATLPCGGAPPIALAVRVSPVAGLNLNPTLYTVANVSLARSDATWARFDTLPAPGQESVYQGGSGIAHCDGTAWSVTDFGTAEVGCPGGAVTPPPEAVRTDLGIDCP